MKCCILLYLATCFALTWSVFVPHRPGHRKQHLLGEKECTYGPSYWCENLMNAGDCHATKHCIQTVWIHKKLPPDTTSICDTCKEMVQQARDQLESNETQELIKEVFEGSCALLKLKPIVKECDKIADDYIPDLIDTLASEMNPQVVCSVAGLCNSAKVQHLLEAYADANSTKSPAKDSNQCTQCNVVMEMVVKNFNAASQDDVLQSFLRVCGRLSSFSDSCSTLVITHFDDIYSYIKDNLNARDMCLLSGECYANFHKHEVEITPKSNIGYVSVNSEKDDMPCEFCKQMIVHARDILVANTTEMEFREILDGICKQTGSYKTECLNLVAQYYPEVYDYLVNSLNATDICNMIGICTNNTEKPHIIAPLLLTPEAVNQAAKLGLMSKPLSRVHLKKDNLKLSSQDLRPEEQQLPIDLLVPPHTQVIYNQQLCTFCEYFLHYVQRAITSPRVEEDIKHVIEEACEKLPSSVNATCMEFVNTYEPALVAILAQEIDPSQVCPLIKACPSSKVKDVDVFIKNAQSSSKCPLCLYAVTELESMIADKQSQDEIKEALGKVCSRLPASLKTECVDFIDTYTNQLIEMIIADFKPQEVCVYLKLCTDDAPVRPENLANEHDFVGADIETNIIEDNTVEGRPVTDTVCVLCEFIMKEIDDQLKDKTTDDEIKDVVKGICKVMPATIKNQCDDYVNKYGDAIIALLQQALEPDQICTMMKMCTQNTLHTMKVEIFDCAICEAAVTSMQKILSNPNVDHDIQHVLEKTCRGLPEKNRAKCMRLVDDFGQLVFDLLTHDTTSEQICARIGYCKSGGYRLVKIL